jgi:hypothetical protein
MANGNKIEIGRGNHKRLVGIGDRVGFKQDIENDGTIIAIERNAWNGGYTLTLENLDGFDGDYIRGTRTTETADRCW